MEMVFRVFVWREGNARETGTSLDASEDGGDEDGVEGVVGEAAELVVFGLGSVDRAFVRRSALNIPPWRLCDLCNVVYEE